MPVNWKDIRKEIFPIKSYDDLCRRWQEAFAYAFVGKTYNFTMPEMAEYTRHLLGEDTRNRYGEYARTLIETCQHLHRNGVADIQDLIRQLGTCEEFEILTERTTVGARELAAVLKYLVYWFIPSKKLLSGLVSHTASTDSAIQVLRSQGIRTNLDLLQQGLTPSARQTLVKSSGLSKTIVNELVNRADFSRMPWASKATISNIIGAGYGSLSKLARVNSEQLYRDFHNYGISIGKNLKFGNEIDNSYRIAQIMPQVLEE